jgi:porphobilinogen synthase
MVQETDLSVRNLILPVFVREGIGIKESIDNMPGVYRYSPDQLLLLCEQCVNLGIPAIALFPYIDSSKKDHEGSEAINPLGLIPSVVQDIKSRFPNLGTICDVALDPYTLHGQDGIPNESGYLQNDLTVRQLVIMSQVLVEAGCDILAPSDMMDGRIGHIRRMLETGHGSKVHAMIMSYSAKYASSFYAPFRDAVGSAGALGRADKNQYQMNPANTDEALREVEMDINEGADMVMIKPGLPYLDIVRRVKDTFNYPTYVYHVSGEYSMLKAASTAGYLDYDKTSWEVMQAFRRAGADGILTYCALDIARRLM